MMIRLLQLDANDIFSLSSGARRICNTLSEQLKEKMAFAPIMLAELLALQAGRTARYRSWNGF
jgi:hypothetical protein